MLAEAIKASVFQCIDRLCFSFYGLKRDIKRSMNRFKENWIRILYVVVSVLIMLAAIYCVESVVGDGKLFNRFSYFGTVATAIGLIVAFAEVLHSLHISKGIREEARSILNSVKRVQAASIISECLYSLDEAAEYFNRGEYFISVKCFLHFRRQYIRIRPSDEIEADIDGLLRDIERTLHAATRSSAHAPVDKRTQTILRKNILSIKESIEKISPSRGISNAS